MKREVADARNEEKNIAQQAAEAAELVAQKIQKETEDKALVI